MDFREFSMGYRLWVEKEMRRRLASGRRDGRRENGGVKEEGLGDWRKSSRDSYKVILIDKPVNSWPLWPSTASDGASNDAVR
ncbi:hypothetical protein HZH68_010591 [Vespula germanica]|uniref:Uncharacterized protein n=1 Tax=Vespula germanica TaxID=30212 RepID=A0A834JSY3_VESGE|nr:hypothetical protein HZH68_010591 [Vespula germanica]